VKVFQTAPARKKKLVVMKRLVAASKKSTLKTIRKDIVARASVALSGETAKKERELVRVLSLGSDTVALPPEKGTTTGKATRTAKRAEATTLREEDEDETVA
jgi:hypothetical protein